MAISLALLRFLASSILLNAFLHAPVLRFALLLLLTGALLLSLGLRPLALLMLAVLPLAHPLCLLEALLLFLLLTRLPIHGLFALPGLSLILSRVLLIMFAAFTPFALLLTLCVVDGWASQKQKQNCCARDPSLCLHGRLPTT